MPVTQSAGGSTGEGGATGTSPTGQDMALAAEVERLRADLYALTGLFEDLRAKYNAHAHTENTAPAYIQNAITQPPPAGSQVTTQLITG